ncbi:putative G-type lectin S-receptor-like serine/threonine-protein kinase SD2-5-like [Capsicum annuum]|nr:putative G-type lectin S-receptor-like serine/threonine-protein kinase SD2-5-like [Capsicum annuum]
MISEQKQYFPILFFIHLLFCYSSGNLNAGIWNSIAGVPTLWINRPSLRVSFTTDILTPILEGNGNPRFLFGFSCNYDATECFLGVSLVFYNSSTTGNIDAKQLVWSANKNHPVKTNATLQLGQDGNLVLEDSDGALVWSTNTNGQSISGLNLTEMGNLVLLDKTNCIIWQSFDHPTDSLLPGQSLVSGRKLIASVSETNPSQGLLALTILNGSWATYIDSDPPQFYYVSSYPDSTYFSFDGQTLTALQNPPRPAAQFIKLGSDGHLRVYQWGNLDWEEEYDILTAYWGNCGYPMFNHELRSSIFSLEGKKLEDCQKACLSNCSCKAAIFRYYQNGNRKGSYLLLYEVFSLVNNEYEVDTTVFLKVQNPSKSPVISPRIIGSTFAALLGIILILTTYYVLSKRRIGSRKVVDSLDLEPLLPGILTRFSYSDLKIITEDFCSKLGEGGFGSVYEGTLSSGTKVAVKHLHGLGQVKDSFLTEVKTIGGIHHINLITHEDQENGLPWHTRQRIILDIAKGLVYLHEDCSQKIIHLDIKPQNILLDQNFNAKISDFGLSKLIEKDKSKIVTRMRETPVYLAPEWLSSVITEKVDVYAFGIVLLEILCGRKNFDWSQTDEEDYHLLSVFRRKAEQEKLIDMVDKNEDMQLHREAVTEMMSLAVWCLQGDFTKRPSMSLVVKALEGLVTVQTNLEYNFRNVPKAGAGNQQREATISLKSPSVLSGPR